MAILNLSKEIYELIKEDAYQNRRKIVEQAQYYILLGKFFTENQHSEFLELNEKASNGAKQFKTTN